MRFSRTEIVTALLLLAVVLGVLVLARVDDADQMPDEQPILQSNERETDSLEPTGLASQNNSRESAGKAIELSGSARMNDHPQAGADIPPDTQPDIGISLFYQSESEYRDVSAYWRDQFKADRASWVDRLDRAFLAETRTPVSDELESKAALATIVDPKFRYEPPLTVSALVVNCRNDICKVEIPATIKSFPVRRVPIHDPDDSLHPNDRVLFDHGFGHSVSQFNTQTGIRTNYFLANGFEFTD